ncbi:MAG: hypothetical protein V1913_05875 [Fibrobacterota bacterium]
MNAVSSNQNSASQIEQYKTYFKQLNIAQNGASVLLQALNENKSTNTDDWFGTGTDSTDVTDLVPAAVVNINKEKVEKKLWQDLEAEILAYQEQHPELKDKLVVAVNADTEDGQPAFTVAKSEDILALLNDKGTAQDALKGHPVQLFESANLNVGGLKSAGETELEQMVQAFMQKNRGVFQYFNQKTPESGLAGLSL